MDGLVLLVVLNGKFDDNLVVSTTTNGQDNNAVGGNDKGTGDVIVESLDELSEVSVVASDNIEERASRMVITMRSWGMAAL